MMTTDQIQSKIGLLQLTIEELQNSASSQFNEDDCPLKVDHYQLSQLLFGLGQHKWTCEFCNQEHYT